MIEPIRVIPWTNPGPPQLTDLGPSDRLPTKSERGAWAQARLFNPTLHDAPTYAVSHWDASSGTIVVARSSYLLLVAGSPPITTLGVSGVILQSTTQGPRVLLGRRSRNTRIYQRCWETPPRGTVPVPQGIATTEVLTDALRQEAREELLGCTPQWQSALAIVMDPAAHSLDIVFQAEVAPPGKPLSPNEFAPGSWEYEDVLLLPLAVLLAWARGNAPPEILGPADRLSPPTAALFASGLF